MKFHKQIALSALAALPLLAAARPASPELMRHVNPDGKVVEFRLHGNEDFSYITDAGGEALLEFKGGRLVEAVRGGVALRAVDQDLEILRAEQPAFEMPAPKINRMASLWTTGENRGRTTYPTVGKVRSCVILLEYPDRPFISADPKDQFTRLCNEVGYSDYGSVGSARDYYMAASNGKFDVQFDVYGPVRLEHEAAYYTGADDPTLVSSGKSGRFGVAIAEAMGALDDGVDFSIYDYDDNGIIDNIFFFYSGAGQADTGDNTTIWPHQSDYRRYTAGFGSKLDCPRQVRDGVELQCYACSCELNSSYQIPDDQKPYLDGIGAFCHEFGHVLGLPDLYDTAGSGCKTPKHYSLMDQGSYNKLSTCPPILSAYEQWVCMWLDYTEATDGESYTLNPLTSPDRNAVRIRIRQPGGTVSYYSEYYVIESRAYDSWDNTVPEHGMLIWRINYNNGVWSNNEVNIGNSPNVELIQSPDDMTAWPGDWEENTYITPSMKVLVPSCTRKPLDVTITNIAYNQEDGTASFDYNKYKAEDRAPVLDDKPTADPEKRQVFLLWSAVPDVENYALTVKRVDSAGREYTVDGLDETLVGNVTAYTVRNITVNQWTQTFKAYVRVFSGVPASVISNEVTFVPAELGHFSGVGEIGVEVPVIYGAEGHIVAPEGSKVYTTGGIECGMTDLPAGLYIVVAPGATAKVQVR